MKRLVAPSFVVVAAFVAAPEILGRNADLEADPRLVRLQQFLNERSCPVEPLAADFITAADSHQLDWRLLPSLSLVESSGGKYHRNNNNNIFGWANGKTRFPTVRHGIYAVAQRLAESRHYRDKNTDQILRVYNPQPGYAARVRAVMAELGPLYFEDIEDGQGSPIFSSFR
jgi:hypothetical protein